MITGHAAAGVGGSPPGSIQFGYLHNFSQTPTVGVATTARASNGVGGAVSVGIVGVCQGTYRIPAYQGYPVYPSPVDNGMVIQKPIWIAETNAPMGHPIRGELPGMAIPQALLPLDTYDIVDDLIGFSGSMLVLPWRVLDPAVGYQIGRVMIDISGPWR